MTEPDQTAGPGEPAAVPVPTGGGPPRRRPERDAAPRRIRWRLLVLLAAVAVASGSVVAGTVAAFTWMETPEFCGACHTMQPELRAYERSPHNAVECAACHIAPGASGLVKAKLDGTIQLFQLVTNTYERPIPPAGHTMLRSPLASSCRRCHREAPSREDRLVVRHRFQEDEQNTERDVALVLRVAKGSEDARGRGIHWHVRSTVEFLPLDRTMREIEYVRVTERNGAVSEYVSRPLATKLAGDAEGSRERLDQVRTSPELTRMSCITCHNRIGHELLPPDRALDEALSLGAIDKRLPFIKRKGMELLTTEYESTKAAFAAIDGLVDYYQNAYPAVYREKEPQVQAATTELKELYLLVGSPEMGASYRDYPTFLGHRDTEGCFRCHGNRLVRIGPDDTPSNAAVPSGCGTCHTPPQLADLRVVESLLGIPPETHKANMRFSHVEAIREQGGTNTCALCHQPPSCARCHDDDVLRATPFDRAQPGGTAPPESRPRGSASTLPGGQKP